MTATKPKTKKLPTEVKDYLNRNVTFNMFGIVNLNALRAITKTELSDADLKRLIKKEFAKDFGDEQSSGIEFLTKEHIKKATRK